MARMDWDRVRRSRPGAVMAAANTFCARCGRVFIPVRRHHRLCTTCQPTYA